VHTGFWWGDLRDNSKDLGIDGRIILKWIFKKQNEEAWTGLRWLTIGTGDRRCESGNELSGSTKCREFLDELKARSMELSGLLVFS
jgi:hypothetical protein